MDTHIITKTKTPILLLLAALAGFANTALADNHNYNTTTFVADCQLFNGVSKIFENSVTCKKSDGQSIVCLRQGDAVSGCKLEDSLPGQTTATPPSADFFNQTLN